MHMVRLQQELKWWWDETVEVLVDLNSSIHYLASSNTVLSAPSLCSLTRFSEISKIKSFFHPSLSFLRSPVSGATCSRLSSSQDFILSLRSPHTHILMMWPGFSFILLVPIFLSEVRPELSNPPRKAKAKFTSSCFNSQLLNSSPSVSVGCFLIQSGFIFVIDHVNLPNN